jgi:ribosomal protein L34E
MSDDETAKCRGCGRALEGSPYWKGGNAYVPGTKTRNRPYGVRAMGHWYGGWVCSASCNRRVFKDMQSQNVYSSEDARRMLDGDKYFETA